MSSGRVTDALQALMEWLGKAEGCLAEDQPVLGDLDTVSMLLEQHKVSRPLPQEFHFTIHCAVTHAPFHGSMLRPASQAGPMHEAAWVWKLVNAALLTLINEACVNVCCATLLSQLVGPACVQARSSNPRGRACRPSGKGSGEEGILSDVVYLYIYTARLLMSVFL